MGTRVVAAVAIGSSLGDREAHLQFACTRLADVLANLRVSSILETMPVGAASQVPMFLNAAAVGDATGSAHDLLEALLALERERGRERPFPNAPRTLDLDLILFGSQIIGDDRLTVPHPRFRERRFVLKPLAEIAAEMQDPTTGHTVGELLAELDLHRQA